jgi:serine/threonine protein phosphatase PrpC
MWRVFGRSVRGVSHRRRHIPNQDAIKWSATPAGDLALAVADGHGSSACFRSETGAAFAVQCALDLVAEFASRLDFGQHYLDDVEREFKDELIARWRDAVSVHLTENPFTAEELLVVASRAGRTSFTAYGSTLLVALACESQLLLVQIGDGDILMVSGTGRVSRPWPRDARLLGVETTSLCTEDAVSNIRLRVEPLTPESPALVLLCTDGYSNSFRADAGFLKVGTDLLEMIDEDGPESVESNLEGWLEEASSLGSGDDVTLGVLFRSDLFRSDLFHSGENGNVA